MNGVTRIGGLVAAVAVVLVGGFLLVSLLRDSSGKSNPASEAILSASPTLYPEFTWKNRDYVVRCSEAEGSPQAELNLPAGWQARVGDAPFQSGKFVADLKPGAGSATEVDIQRKPGRTANFNLRCLPKDFPEFKFDRFAPGGPRLTFVQIGGNYAALFNGNGTPVWWLKNFVPPLNTQVLADGTLSWLVLEPGGQKLPDMGTNGRFDYAIRDLDGEVIRHVSGAGKELTDAHELMLLDNGNYLINTFPLEKLDTSPFGGPANAKGRGSKLQEITPQGDVVWEWNSRDHIGLEETGRWWDMPVTNRQPIDYIHFNSAEPVGENMVLSFRHLDAVYEINRNTGKINWKLGGTETPERLKIIGDPHGDHPFGGQHDARVDSNGILSVYDNATGLDRPPRVVQYKVDPKKMTATMVSEFTDPEVPISTCCGSAQELPNGEWLVNWGGLGNIKDPEIHNIVGTYKPDGEPISRLWTYGKHMYRAQPITGPFPSAAQLRASMNRHQGLIRKSEWQPPRAPAKKP